MPASAHGGSAVALLPTVDPNMPHGGPAHSHGGFAVEMMRYIMSSNTPHKSTPQHRFTVLAKLSHATLFQVMLAFASMSKDLIVTAHALS
ncbi:hypothetical protein Y032_0004g2241 [Ancylostoma ceylanicum]|uniref:Uncharacterized protein n=1 Tax=Ancylostoma ceylanicum TaxID=53326 RepID=A0A016VX82_9BILA|nr:hypothetical protein Y032_0004g2241 [Ancylostoma ceylanicum]